MIWTILGVISVILLIIFWRSRNAVWGGFTIGAVIGLVVALFSGFAWYIVLRGAIIGILLGFGLELLKKVQRK
ncbi:hypothetical protein ACFLYY_00785 [Patescibacteria group bacterium]